MHIAGKMYRHKFYEWLRRKFSARQNKLLSAMRLTRKLIEHGKIKRLKPGDRSENNVLDKGFLKQRKLKLISRYSKLIILSFRPLNTSSVWLALGLSMSQLLIKKPIKPQFNFNLT